MKYRGIYWSLFAPMIRNSIAKRYSKELADRSIRQGKNEYRKLLAHADELGPGNPMASNAYFAYVFAAAWLGSGREITPEGMGQVMTDVLEGPLLKRVFGITDLNRDPKKWYRDMKKYDRWFRKHGDKYPVNWNVSFDESLHSDDSYYYFTRCPICEFCEREGISELMPALCATDEVMFRLQHGKLHREHTIAGGGDICDYWITGDGSTSSKGVFWDREKEAFPMSVKYEDHPGSRKSEIKSAYRSLGKAHSFYDGMMTGSTALGMAVVKMVWQMDREDMLEYQAGAFEPIPAGFSGKLLEVPVGTGVLSMPMWKTLPDADITCLDYSEKMMEAASVRAKEMGIDNITFVQGDVGALPFEDESFDAVVSLYGFHAFPDKEAAYSETYRVLKPGGTLSGCFYVKDSNKHTDRMINRFYIKSGFFTPPFETAESLRHRLEGMYDDVEVYTIESIAVFKARKR